MLGVIHGLLEIVESRVDVLLKARRQTLNRAQLIHPHLQRSAVPTAAGQVGTAKPQLGGLAVGVLLPPLGNGPVDERNRQGGEGPQRTGVAVHGVLVKAAGADLRQLLLGQLRVFLEALLLHLGVVLGQALFVLHQQFLELELVLGIGFGAGLGGLDLSLGLGTCLADSSEKSHGCSFKNSSMVPLHLTWN